MKRIVTLVVIFLVLVSGYIGLRLWSRPAPFQAPDAIRLDNVDTANIDAITMVFSQDKQVSLAMRNGKWFVADVPADAAKIQRLLDAAKKSSVNARVSGNKQYHDRFDVDAKGVRLTLLEKGEVKKEIILGKAAGGDAVYVRVPDQDDVYVMNAFPRYELSEDVNQWRDRAVADMDAKSIRRVSFVENQVQWDLRKDAQGWKLSTNRIAPIDVDGSKTDTLLTSLTGLRALDFPKTEEIDAAKQYRATSATVTIEVGSVETFERKEVWQVYSTEGTDRWLIIRDSDNTGLYVSKDSFAAVLADYPAVKTKLMADAKPAADASQPADAMGK